MAKKKLAFVDHNYHKKTRSGDFLREIFAKDFIIDDFWWSLNEVNDLIRLGRNEDGGYIVSESIIKSSNYLLAFGMGADWSFEEDFLKLNKNNTGT